MREMILADDEKARRAAIAKLLPMQRGDFVELFEIMQRPAGDHPAARSAAARIPAAWRGGDRRSRRRRWAPTRRSSRNRARELAEFNPMLGFRGCRIAIAYPEIAEMQARAIFEAAVEAGKRTGKPVVPEVMVPLIATHAEFDIVKARIDAMAEAVAKENRRQARLPGRHHDRTAARGADGGRDRGRQDGAEFFSFGTNDLTQTTFGISRDDAASFLGIYTARGILPDRSVRLDRPRGRRRTGADRRRARAQGAARSQGRHLRRAWRRSGFGRLLPRGRARLCVLLAVPRADRAACRGAGGARQGSRAARRSDEATTATLSRGNFRLRSAVGRPPGRPPSEAPSTVSADRARLGRGAATCRARRRRRACRCAALATLCEISPVTAFCSSTAAATADV